MPQAGGHLTVLCTHTRATARGMQCNALSFAFCPASLRQSLYTSAACVSTSLTLLIFISSVLYSPSLPPLLPSSLPPQSLHSHSLSLSPSLQEQLATAVACMMARIRKRDFASDMLSLLHPRLELLSSFAVGKIGLSGGTTHCTTRAHR